MDHRVVSHEEWVHARKELLAREKEFTRARDELSAARRALPWVRVTKPYVFRDGSGDVTLAELFEGRSQLIVYHFMFGPDAEVGCKSCSFWADNFERNVVHLAHRDATMVAISRAPIEKLLAYRARMEWTFRWVSALETDFNFDLGVSFMPDQEGATYNYAPKTVPISELPGISIFARQGDTVFHTYSTYGRGLDMLNAGYHYLDLLPKGRNEAEGGNMAWLRRRDEYVDSTGA